MKTPIAFKIRPDKRGKWKRKGAYMMILVYPTIRDVKAAYKKLYPGDKDPPVAFWHTANINGPEIGFIVLALTRLGIDVIAHESVHAAFSFVTWQMTGRTWGRKVQISHNGEKICQATGNITREITMNLFRLKIWK